MANLSGDELNERLEGSTSAITGETYSSDTKYHKTGDTWFRDKGDGNEYMSKSDSSNGRSNDHIHFYTNEDGTRGCSVTKEQTASDGNKYGEKASSFDPAGALFEGFKNFLGL